MEQKEYEINEQTAQRINDYPRFEECSIQTFNDQNKEDKCQSRILEMNLDNLNKCVKLQTMLPYWIFFSVNPMESWKRNRESIKAIQTWICDIDTGTKEEQLELINKAPIKPSLVVESNHWFHLYYLADKDLTEEEFEKWNLGLREYYNGDIKVCKDIARVLRIPWYYHMKGDKYMVNYRQDLSSKEKYSVEQITKAFPYEEPKKEVKSFITHYKANDIWEKIYNMDQMDLLKEFSWSSWVRWDTFDFKNNSNWEYQIWVNGKSSSCWIDLQHKIWSNDGWSPTIIQWIDRYYKGRVDKHELLEELKRRHPELEDKKEVKVEKLEVNNKEIQIDLPKLEFTRWDKGIDDKVGKLHRGSYVVLLWETWAGKTTFSTFMARHNKNSVYYVLEDKKENIIRRYALRYAHITKEELNSGRISEDKVRIFNHAVKEYNKTPVNMIDVWHSISIETLIASIKEQEAKWVWMFFIDNLWKITAEWKTEAEQIKKISSDLLGLCNDDGICIVLIHHYRKKNNNMEWRWLESIRGSQKLADDSTLVVEYMRDEWENSCRLKVMKDRDWGDPNVYELAYDKWEYTLNEYVI